MEKHEFLTIKKILFPFLLNIFDFQKVYPSPSRRRMDAKGECEEVTYPKIYFAIDSFDEVFTDMVVSQGECVCVELVCRDRYRNTEAVIFLGSIRYDVLKKLYDSRVIVDLI